MKILLATPLYPPDSGGPATDAAHIYSEFPKHGITAVVCSFGSVRHLPRLVRHIWYGVKLYRACKGVDAILAMDTFSVCVPAAIVARLRRAPLVVRVPGDFVWEQSTQRFGVHDTIEDFQHKRYGFVVETMRSVQRAALRSAALVIAPSDFFLGIMANWGIRPERLMRIYLGIDLHEPLETPSIPTQATGKKILFSLGRLVPWKGFEMLIELMTKLSDEWHLVIVGDGPQRATLEHKIHELGVEKHVTLLGFIPRPQVLGWYRVADAFALNTTQENFSFQVVEGMNSGTPTITTTIGSLPELITSGVEGILCEPDDAEVFMNAIQSTQTDRALWNTRTEAAKKKAEEFSIEKSVRELSEALKTVCA